MTIIVSAAVYVISVKSSDLRSISLHNIFPCKDNKYCKSSVNCFFLFLIIVVIAVLLFRY